MKKRILPIGLALLQAFMFGCMLWYQQDNADPAPASPTLQPTGAEKSIELFFSEPYSPLSEDLEGGPDEELAAAIKNASFSVDMAIYNLNLWSIRDALLEAASNGVRVRVVTEYNNFHKAEIRSLQNAGIPVHSDERNHLMHHKFVVIDDAEVWTGSMNFTVNGAYHNNNNLVRLRSSELAADYTREFEEMFVQDAYGLLSESDTPYPEVLLGDTLVEVYFSPDEGYVSGNQISARLVDLIESAEESVYLLAFSFTSNPIAEALLEQYRAGLDVRGVVESSQINASGAKTNTLRSAGVDLRLDGNPDTMHHKVLIIDEQIMVLGSYNFTRSAEEKNDENLLILHSPSLVSQFLIEFDKIYHNASP
jgi:phosphatidylserine/phosphatidylglycerophosphate/cardiolipin synthase-like enzyme